MSDFGFKVSLPGVDAQTALHQELIASTILPTWKCDLRSTPKHYGTINFTIASITASQSITIYQIAHGYSYIPSFVTAWSYPAGTGGGASTNQTFGIGDIDCTLGSGLVYVMKTDATNFTVTATNNSASTRTSLAGAIRFYIFADNFTP